MQLQWKDKAMFFVNAGGWCLKCWNTFCHFQALAFVAELQQNYFLFCESDKKSWEMCNCKGKAAEIQTVYFFNLVG